MKQIKSLEHIIIQIIIQFGHVDVVKKKKEKIQLLL